LADQVQEAIKIIESGKRIRSLRRCESLRERHEMLMTFLPGMWCMGEAINRQIVFRLQREHGIDLGTCEFCVIEGDKQSCMIGDEETEPCSIPQAYCPLRDKNGPPKYPEFLPVISPKQAGDPGLCLGF